MKSSSSSEYFLRAIARFEQGHGELLSISRWWHCGRQQRRLVAAHAAQPAVVIGALLAVHVQHLGVRQDQEALVVDGGEHVVGHLGGFEHLARRGDGAGRGDAERIARIPPPRRAASC